MILHDYYNFSLEFTIEKQKTNDVIYSLAQRFISCLQEEKKTLKERLHAIQEVTQTVQNAIGYIASLGEQIKK